MLPGFTSLGSAWLFTLLVPLVAFYFLKLKRNETGRFLRFLEASGANGQGDEPTEWEQNEYFDFF